MFDWVENILLAKSLNFNIKFTLVPSLQIKPRKYSAGKYLFCWKIIFEKTKGRGEEVNRTSVDTEAAVRRVL